MSSNEATKQAVMVGMGVNLLSPYTSGLEPAHGLIAVPRVEGLPVMRRRHVVDSFAKTLSPAAETFRCFVLEHGEAHPAEQFPALPRTLNKPPARQREAARTTLSARTLK